MLKAHTVQIVIKSLMIYYFLSFVILMITFYTSVRAHKPGNELKRNRTIYVLYVVVTFGFALSPIEILDDVVNTSRSYFSIYFTVFFLLLIIFSIVILKIDKGTDKSKKVIFSVVILNLFVSLIYWGVCISSSRYQYLYSDKDNDNLFDSMTDFLYPETSVVPLLPGSGWLHHEYDMDKNYNIFVRNCVVKLPEIASNKELAEYATEQIKKITWPKYIQSVNVEAEKHKEEAMKAFNAVMYDIEGVSKDEFEKNVCRAYYVFLSARKNAWNKYGQGSVKSQKSSVKTVDDVNLSP